MRTYKTSYKIYVALRIVLKPTYPEILDKNSEKMYLHLSWCFQNIMLTVQLYWVRKSSLICFFFMFCEKKKSLFYWSLHTIFIFNLKIEKYYMKKKSFNISWSKNYKNINIYLFWEKNVVLSKNIYLASIHNFIYFTNGWNNFIDG